MPILLGISVVPLHASMLKADYGSFWTASDVDDASQLSQSATFVTVTSDGLSVGINPDGESFFESGFLTQKSMAGPFDASLWLPGPEGSRNDFSNTSSFSSTYSKNGNLVSYHASDIDPTPLTATPEPSTLGLLWLSLGFLMLVRALARA